MTLQNQIGILQEGIEEEAVEEDDTVGMRIGGTIFQINIGGNLFQIRQVFHKILSIAIIVARIIMMKKIVILNKNMRLKIIEVETILEAVEGTDIGVILLRIIQLIHKNLPLIFCLWLLILILIPQ